MKNTYKFFFVFISSLLLFSCTKGDIVTGSPVGTNLPFVNLPITVSSTETDVVGGQPVPVLVTLPQTFDVAVSVEVTAALHSDNPSDPGTGKRSRTSVIIPAGQATATMLMIPPGGDASVLGFNYTLYVYASAITTDPAIDISIRPAGFPGVQYVVTSPIVPLTFRWGTSFLSANNAAVLSINVDWEGPYGPDNPVNNNLKYIVKRNGVLIPTIPQTATTTSIVYGKNQGKGKTVLNIQNTDGTGSTSNTDGTYDISLYATKLVSTPMDLPYRFTVRFPDNSAKTFYGVLLGITVGPSTGAIAKLRVVKTTVAGVAQYAITQL